MHENDTDKVLTTETTTKIAATKKKQHTKK